MFAETECLRRDGKDVLVDATFSRRARREEIYKICRNVHASLIVLSCTAAPHILRERMRARLQSAVTAPKFRFDTLDSVQRENEPIALEEFDGLDAATLFEVDTNLNVARAMLEKGEAKFGAYVTGIFTSLAVWEENQVQ